MNEQQLRKYAELTVRVGTNLQPGQHLVIGFATRQVYPEHVAFARLLVDAGYDAGAKFVHIDWGDEWWQRETVRRGSLDTWAARAKWQAAWIEQLAQEGAAFIAIPASDPKLYDGLNADRVALSNRHLDDAFRPFNDKRTNGDYSWTLVSVPTQAWADYVFPQLPHDERVEALWQAILACARADGDNPLEAWRQHLDALGRRRDWMNQLQIRSLHYVAPGTDLTVELPPTHFWASALQDTPDGTLFTANIPTEEVYTSPLRTGVNGVVSSTMPLNHSGSIIEGIRLRFDGGRIVEYTASKGLDALTRVIEADDGSHYLGEVALVPVDSPISERGVLFYNTLFDENASCHLAIGKAYALLEGARELPLSEWAQHGLNTSVMHVDFMIGSPEMRIDAVTRTGLTITIMRDGRWVESV